jgi:hypothetical protein
MEEDAQALFRTIDDRFGLAWCLHSTGQVQLKLGKIDGARKTFLEAMALFEEANDISGKVLQLDNLSEVIRRDGDPYLATRLASAARAQQGVTGANIGALVTEREGRTGHEGLSKEQADQAWAEGQAMSLEEAIAQAVRSASKPTATAAS